MKNKVKDFFRKWAKGIRDLSEEAVMKNRIFAIKGNIIGMTIGTGFLIYRGFWYFSIFLVFTIYLQCMDLIQAKQTLKNMIGIATELQLQQAEKLIGVRK